MHLSRVVALAGVLIMVTGGAAAWAQPEPAAAEQIPNWSVEMEGISPNRVDTGLDGQVFVTGCDARSDRSSIRLDKRGELESIVFRSPNYDENACYLGGLGKNGDLYYAIRTGYDAEAQETTDLRAVVAYDSDGQVWSWEHTCPEDEFASLGSLNVGADGNVYASASCTNQYDYSMRTSKTVSLDGTTGQLRPVTQLPAADLYMHRQGIIALESVDGQRVARYFDYLGNEDLEKRFVLEDLSLGAPAAVDPMGTLYYGRYAEGGCTGGSSYFKYVIRRTLNGTITVFEDPINCSFVGRIYPLAGSRFAIGLGNPGFWIPLPPEDLYIFQADGQFSITPFGSYSTGRGAIEDVVADLNGNAVVQRRLYSSGQTQESSELAVVDTSGRVVWNLRSLDLYNDSRPPFSNKFKTFSVSRGALHVVHCTNLASCNSNDSPLTLSRFGTSAVGGNYMRDGLIVDWIEEPAAPVSYVALGDSFSSGEGVEPFMPPTDVEGGCHRSEHAYPRLLDADGDIGVQLQSGGFVACSGATTHTVRVGMRDEPGQLDQLNSQTDLVTITIGGNDVGFKPFAEACVLSDCSDDEFRDALNKVQRELPMALEVLYGQIRSRASNARILVVGYPHLVPLPDTAFQTGACLQQPYLSNPEIVAIWSLVSELNAVIEQAAEARVLEFVDPNENDSPFAGHDLCDSAPHFNGPNWPNKEYSFYPNRQGQAAYARLISDVYGRAVGR